MSDAKRGKKLAGRLVACVIGGALMTGITALLPALTRDEPWLSALSEESRGQAGEHEVVALTGGDAWLKVSAVWIDVPQSAAFVSLREQEVRSVTGLGSWAVLPSIVESNRRYESIATGLPMKFLVGCRLMDVENPTQVASTITLARPTWNAKVRSVPTGVRPLGLAVNLAFWSALIGLVAVVPLMGKKTRPA